MPDGLQTSLGWLGHDVDTTVQEGLAGNLDPKVWAASQATGRFLVTQDLDFSDLRAFIATKHHGVLVVRLKNPTRRELAAFTQALFESENPEAWAGCLRIHPGASGQLSNVGNAWYPTE